MSWDTVVPANDLCSNAAYIPGWAGTRTSPLYDTPYATTSACELASTCGAASNGHSVFFSYTPGISGLFSIDTMGGDYDTVLSVHSGCSTTAGAICVQPATFACNDDLPGGPLTSGIFNLPVSAGQHYLIKVAAYGSSGASYLMLHTSLTEQSPCNADYNNDGSADLSDVFDLSNDIAAGTQSFPPSSPDFNNDGSADLSDVMDISNVVAGGPCP